MPRFFGPSSRALVGLALALAGPCLARAVDLAIDEVEWRDPDLPAPPSQLRFSKSVVPLWRQALARQDAEPRRLACDTIGLAAGRGMTGLDELVAPLSAIVADDPDPLVRRAAAGALVALDARGAADVLAKAAARDGVVAAAIVEPALARWGSTVATQPWLDRLSAADTPPALVALAVDGLGRTGAEAAAEPLERLLLDADARPEQRLAAARALGRIRDAGLVPLAERLAASPARPGGPRADPRTPPDLLGRLAAVRLLARHADAAALALVTRLAEDTEPTVAAEALERLDALDAGAALAIARRSLAGPDAALRLLAARLAVRPADADAVERVKHLLSDRNPPVRRFVAGTLADFATRPELHGPVIAAGSEVLGGDDWRGLEQAALLLGHLDHEPSGDRLLALLDHSRPEVAIAAAWGLKALAIPEMLPRILTYAEALAPRVDPAKQPTEVTGAQATQLFELFGLTRYAPADALLRGFVPKSQLDTRARAAAIWALGWIHADNPDEELAEQLAERLADTTSLPPEMPAVRTQSAVALGRMGARSQLRTLEQFVDADGIGVPSGRASAWAVERLTGKPYPEIPTITTGIRGWFLEPP